MKHIVVVSRKWDHPKISMIVTDEELSFAMDLMDFMTAVKREMVTGNGIDVQIDEAVQKVIKAIKGESTRIM